jgi:hypothetical protein
MLKRRRELARRGVSSNFGIVGTACDALLRVHAAPCEGTAVTQSAFLDFTAKRIRQPDVPLKTCIWSHSTYCVSGHSEPLPTLVTLSTMFRALPTTTITRVVLRSKEGVTRTRPLPRSFSTAPRPAHVLENPEPAPFVENVHGSTAAWRKHFPSFPAENKFLAGDSNAAAPMYHPTHEEDTEAFAATEALKQRQIRIEAEQLQEAVEGYKQSFKHLSGMGKGTSMKSTQRLLLDWYEPLLQALENELKSIATGKVLADRRVIKPRSNYLLLALVSHVLWVFFSSW